MKFKGPLAKLFRPLLRDREERAQTPPILTGITPSKPLPPLPLEVWRVVFGHAIRSPALLKTIWDYHPSECLWKRWERCGAERREQEEAQKRLTTGLSVIRVCRDWYLVGVEFLYETLDLQCNNVGPALKGIVNALERTTSAGSDGLTRVGGYG